MIGSNITTFSVDLALITNQDERNSYQIWLRVTDVGGSIGTDMIRMHPEGFQNTAPVAVIKSNPDIQNGYVNISAMQPIRLDSSNSSDVDLDLLDILWDFGDGVISRDAITTRILCIHSSAYYFGYLWNCRHLYCLFDCNGYYGSCFQS